MKISIVMRDGTKITIPAATVARELGSLGGSARDINAALKDVLSESRAVYFEVLPGDAPDITRTCHYTIMTASVAYAVAVQY